MSPSSTDITSSVSGAGADPLKIESELRDRGIEILRPLTELLQKMVEEGDPAYAVPALKALGKIGDERVVPILLDLTSNDQMAEEAIIALSHMPGTEVLDRLLSVLSSSVPKITAACVAVLWKFGEERIVEKLAPLAMAAHTPIRKAVMESLGRLGIQEGVEALYHGLKDQDEDVVIESLKALRGLKLDDRDQLAEQLSRLYESVDNARIRATIVCAFSTIEDSTMLDLAKKALRDPNPRVRANAVELIGAMPLAKELKIAILKPVFQEGENNRVLGNVAVALAPIDESTSIQILSKLLNSVEKWERASAVYAARYIQSDRITQWLTTQYTAEDDPDVLRNLIDSLSHFTGKEVTACFIRALGHSNSLIRIGAARSLGRIADPTAESHLIRAMSSEEDAEVIAEFISALGLIADPSRISTVARFLQYTDLRVQANTIDALANIGTVEIIPYVEPFLNSSDNRVKANAAVALFNAGSLTVVDELRQMLSHPNIKQRLSAVYAAGEIGESLRDLRHVGKYMLLIAALKEDLKRRPMNAAEDTEPALPEPGSGRGCQLDIGSVEKTLEAIVDGDPTQSRRRLAAALDVIPDDPSLRYLLAEHDRRHARFTEALEGYAKLDALDPAFVNSYIHRASLFSKQKRVAESLDAYFGALEQQAAIVLEQIRIGKALLSKDAVSEASLLLKGLVAQFPIDSRIHFKAGMQMVKSRHAESAVKHLRRAYLVSPREPDVLLKFALACLETGRLDDAEILAHKLDHVSTEQDDFKSKARKLLTVIEKRRRPG